MTFSRHKHICFALLCASLWLRMSCELVAQQVGDTVILQNDAPSISSIPDQTIFENSSTGDLAFTVTDPNTPVNDLTVLVSSSNPSLVPSGSVRLGGTGPSRTITVTPIADQAGSTAI